MATWTRGLLALALIGCQSGEAAEAGDALDDTTTSGDGDGDTVGNGDGDTMGDGDGDTMGDGDGEPEPEGCECIVDEQNENSQNPMLPTCGGGSLCDLVEAVDDDGDFQVPDPAALECALTALRDRTPGLLRYKYVYGFGAQSEFGYILILDDGRAVHRSWGWNDLYFSASDAWLAPLRPAADFDSCLASGNPSTRLGCIRQPLAYPPPYPPPADAVICDEGWPT